MQRHRVAAGDGGRASMSTAANQIAVVESKTASASLKPLSARTRDLMCVVAVYLAITLLWPRPASVDAASWRRFGVFVATLAGLILQPLPAAAVVFVGIIAAVVLGGLGIDRALSGFGEPSEWLLLGAMFMARALTDTGLSRRVALLFVRRFGGSSLGFVYSLVLTDVTLAGGIPSISARSGGIILPIARSAAELYDSRPGETAGRLGGFLMAALYQASVVACAMFLTGQAGNLLAAGLAAKIAGVTVSWSSWFFAAVVPGAVSCLVIPYVVYRVLPPEIKSTPAAPEFARRELRRLGRLSTDERILLVVFGLVCLLWMTSAWTRVNVTVVTLAGIAALLVANVLTWEEILRDRAAWDVFVWYGGLLMLGEMLNSTGVPAAFTTWIGASLTTLPWFGVLLVTLVIYFYTHYAFATVTVHVLAMFAPFVALVIGLGAPPKLAVYAFACLAALPAGLTHYGTTTAPMFINGYVSVKDWWRVGLIASFANLLIWLTIGFAWWKLLGFW
jgi:DASS family divalent anion:Na+ symporter